MGESDMEIVSVASDEGIEAEFTPSAPSSGSGRKPEQSSLHRYGRCTFTTTQGSVVETTGPRSSSSSEKPWAGQTVKAESACAVWLRIPGSPKVVKKNLRSNKNAAVTKARPQQAPGMDP